MTSQLEKKLIAMHLLSNMSKRKRYQAIKFDQLIERNLRKTFFDVMEKLSLDAFLKNQN